MQQDEQCGFRRCWRCMHQVIEKDVFHASIDLENTYFITELNAIWQMLRISTGKSLKAVLCRQHSVW